MAEEEVAPSFGRASARRGREPPQRGHQVLRIAGSACCLREISLTAVASDLPFRRFAPPKFDIHLLTSSRLPLTLSALLHDRYNSSMTIELYVTKSFRTFPTGEFRPRKL